MAEPLNSVFYSHGNIKIDDEIEKKLRVDFQNYSFLASTVLRKRTKYETVEIGGFFDECVDETGLIRNFWSKVGTTATELVIDPRFYVHGYVSRERFYPIFNNFVCLKKLKINSSYLYLFPTEFYKINKSLEIIDIYSGDDSKLCIFEKEKLKGDSEALPENRGGRRWVKNVLESVVHNSNDGLQRAIRIENDCGLLSEDEEIDYKNWDILYEFRNICKYTPSLKKISFPCNLRFNYDLLNEAITHLSNTYLCVDELFIDYDTLFSYPNCSVSKIEIEIEDTNKMGDKVRKKAIVKFTEIEILMKPLNNETFRTEGRFCFFHHYNCTNSTIKSVAVLLWDDNFNSICNVCHKCLDSIINSFPNARCFLRNNYHHRNLHLSVIIRMSKLPHQTHLKLSYWKDLKMWPVFEQLKCLDIELDANQSPMSITHLCQCCPNLEKFIIKFNFDYIKGRYITIKEDILVDIITKHLSKLKILEIEPELKIGSKSLNKICVNLKRLKKIKIGYDDDLRVVLAVFIGLPRLELIEYNSKSLSYHEFQLIQDNLARRKKEILDAKKCTL